MAIFAGAALPVAGCGDSQTAGAATPQDDVRIPVTWTVEPRPQLDIGEAEGDDRYLFHEITSVVRLPNGNIAVLNAGSGEIRFYDAQGGHLRTTGGTGSGPGEYRMPARLYLTHPDSLLVFDSGTQMETVLDTAGTFERAVRYEVSEDETFTRDAWLYRRMLVDGPMLPGDRPALRPALDHLPPMIAADSFRFVKLDGFGRLWTRAEPHNPDLPSEWQVYGSDGEPLATVKLPARFEMHDVGVDHIAGRAWDSMNVERVQLYTYTGTVSQTEPRRAGVANSAPPAVAHAAMSDEVRREMQSLLRNTATQQEIFYSKEYTYAGRTDQLEWPEDMKGFIIHITAPGPGGYTMLIFHAESPGSCGMAMGRPGPVGWRRGIVSCS